MVSWLCCWARCWMFKDMDHMETSCVFYVKVRIFDQLEQSEICNLTVTLLGIVMPSIQQNWMDSSCFMPDAAVVLGQSSPDIHSIEDTHLYTYQKWDFCCRSPQYISVNQYTTPDQLTANCGIVRILCHLQLFAVEFLLSRICKLAATHSILTWS